MGTIQLPKKRIFEVSKIRFRSVLFLGCKPGLNKMDKQKTKKKQHVKLDGFKIYLDAEWTMSNTPISIQVLITHKDGFEGTYIVISCFWAELDLNQRRRTPADLQSASFNHSDIDPT